MDGGMLFCEVREPRGRGCARRGCIPTSEVVVTCEQIPILKFCNHVIIQHLPRRLWLLDSRSWPLAS